MSLVFQCRACHQEIVVAFLGPGEITRCKHCGADNVVPLSGSRSEGTDDTANKPILDARLRSAGIARGLLWCLWILLGLDITLFILAYMSRDMPAPVGHTTLGPILITVVGISTLVSIVAVVIFFVWIFDLHRDLADYFAGYPVTPISAFFRLLVPVYNLWGTWTVFVTMVRTFQEDSDELRRSGITLYSWLVIMYTALVLSYLYVGEKIVTAFQPQTVITYQDLFTAWDLFGIVLAIVTLIAYIGMTQTISIALNEKNGNLKTRTAGRWNNQVAP